MLTISKVFKFLSTLPVCRSSRPEVLFKKGVLRNFAKFTEKHLCQQACNFIKKESLAVVFSCEFCKICKNTFFTEQLRWLLLCMGTENTLVAFKTK